MATATNKTKRARTSEASQARKDKELGEAVADRFKELLNRRTAAVESTELTTEAGATAEWLFSDCATGFPTLRGRFEHGLSNVSDETLERYRALISNTFDALRENDAEALEEAASFWDLYMGVGGLQAKLVRATAWVDRAATGLEENPDYASRLVFFLTTFDSRFGTLSDEYVERTLRAVRKDNVRRDGKPKGGAGNLQVRGALAQLVAQSGAFDVSDAKAAGRRSTTRSITFRNDLGKTAPSQGAVRLGSQACGRLAAWRRIQTSRGHSFAGLPF